MLNLLMKFQLLIKTKMLKNKLFSFKLSVDVFIMVINVKMPKIVDMRVCKCVKLYSIDSNFTQTNQSLRFSRLV